MSQFNSIVIGCLIIQRLHTRLERHLEPLAIAANTTQATHCRLDTILLTFGYLVMRYRAMVAPEDHVGCMAILNSLEKRWFVADQNVFIATVIVNPFYQTTPFAPHSRFINHWGQRGCYPGGKLRVYWELLNNIPSICPLGKLRIFEDLFFTSFSTNPVGKVRAYSKKAHHFDLNIPSGQIKSLITKNPPIYLWATLWKNPWVSFIN